MTEQNQAHEEAIALPANSKRGAGLMSLLNRTQVKRFALEVSRQKGRKFSSVSSAFVEGVEAALRETIAARVHGAKGGKRL